jgi:enamine deaminase RidA (YjgF/YER057c/UK114 family)
MSAQIRQVGENLRIALEAAGLGLKEVRKATLASVLAKAAPGIRLNVHIEAEGRPIKARSHL